MNFKLELPEDSILINRNELKQAILEILNEVEDEKDLEDVMTIKETADYLKISIPTVRSLIASNEIPFFRRGQVIRLNRSDVKEWMRNNSK